jgi:Kelch motif
MNLPSLTRTAFATGFLPFLLALSALAANPTPTPPHLHIKKTTLKLPPTESGASAALNNQLYYAGGTVPGGTVTNVLTDIDTFKHTVTALSGMPTARTGLGLTAAFSATAPGGNVLYAIGGTNGTSVLGTNEVYDVANGTGLHWPRCRLRVLISPS